MTTPTLREAAMAALPEPVRFKLASIAAECSDPDTTDALDELLKSTALTAAPESLEGQAKFSVADLARASNQKALPIMRSFARGGHNVTLNQQLGLAEVADALSAPHQQAAQAPDVFSLPAAALKAASHFHQHGDLKAALVAGLEPDTTPPSPQQAALSDLRAMHDVSAWPDGEPQAAQPLIHIAPDTRKGKPPCGECHLNPGEVCDICGAKEPQQAAQGGERAAFEAWARNEWQNATWPDAAWIGWSARAAQGGRDGLTDERIDTVTMADRDALMDHVNEYGTTAEGQQRYVRRIARAIERAHGIGITTPAGDSE